jgi:hypothetical protein
MECECCEREDAREYYECVLCDGTFCAKCVEIHVDECEGTE